jgi:hypothetical protein
MLLPPLGAGQGGSSLDIVFLLYCIKIAGVFAVQSIHKSVCFVREVYTVLCVFVQL